MDKWEYQNKPCCLENRVRELCKRRTACIWYPFWQRLLRQDYVTFSKTGWWNRNSNAQTSGIHRYLHIDKKKRFLVSLRGLQSMSNPVERPCTLDPNNNKLFFHKKLFMKRWNTQKCLYYSSHHNTYSTVKPGICGNKKKICGIWGLHNYHRKSVVGG